MFEFVRNLGEWRERARFRSSLSRLIDNPHLAADLGFDLYSVKAERSRLPWEPVRLRRGPNFRDGASQTTPSAARRPVATVTPAGAERT